MAQYLHIRSAVRTERTRLSAFTLGVGSDQTEVTGNWPRTRLFHTSRTGLTGSTSRNLGAIGLTWSSQPVHTAITLKTVA